MIDSETKKAMIRSMQRVKLMGISKIKRYKKINHVLNTLQLKEQVHHLAEIKVVWWWW